MDVPAKSAVGLVLAAGGATRMGRPKALLPVGGETLLASIILRLLEAPLSRVVVILGSEAQAIIREAKLPSSPHLTIVENESWREGVASSLRCALAVEPSAACAVVALGDQPGVEPSVVSRLLELWRCGAPLALPVHDGRAGHPVLFDRSLFPELRTLQGDSGAREVIRRHWEEAATVSARPLWDIDTPADYRAFAEGAPARREGLEWPPV